MSGRSGLEADFVIVDGGLVLCELIVTAEDLDVLGVLTITPAFQGVSMVVDPDLILTGIKVLGDDGVTDVTDTCGGLTLTMRTDGPYPSSFVAAHDDGDVLETCRFTCPSASLGPRSDVVVGGVPLLVTYSGTLQRWVLGNAGA